MLKNITSTLKSSIIYGIGNISVKLTGIVLFPLYTHKFSISEYGILGILEVTSQLIIAIVGLNLHASLFRFYFDKKYIGKRKELILTIFATTVLVALGFTFIGLPFSDAFSDMLFNTTNYSQLIYYLLIASSIQVINTIPSTLLRIKEKPVFYSIANVSRVLAVMLSTIYFVGYHNTGIIGIYYGQIIGNVLFLSITLHYLIKNSTLRFNYRLLYEMLSYSTPLIFSSISGVILTVLDRFCLNKFSSLDEVGVYSTGYKIANILLFIVMAFQLALPPIYFKKSDDDDRFRFYSKVMTYASYGLMILVIAMSAFGNEIVKLMAQQSSYWRGAMVIPFISFSILFNAMRYLLTLNLNLAKKSTAIAIIVIIMSALNLLLNILLIPRYHAMGAAFSTLFTQICYLLFTYIISQRIYPVKYEVRKLLILSLIGFILVVISLQLNSIGIYGRILFKSLLVISFPVILYFFNFYEKIELERIADFWLFIKRKSKLRRLN